MQTSKNLLIAGLAIALSSLVPGAARAQDDGEKVFKRFCSACHTTESGTNRIGPSLAGVVGRKAGSVPAFNYSEASRNSGVTWDAATLDKYLTDPKAFMPGTKMVFIGVRKEDERQALIAYLKTQTE